MNINMSGRALAGGSSTEAGSAFCLFVMFGSGLQAELSRARDRLRLCCVSPRPGQAKAAKGQACTFRPGFFVRLNNYTSRLFSALPPWPIYAGAEEGARPFLLAPPRYALPLLHQLPSYRTHAGACGSLLLHVPMASIRRGRCASVCERFVDQ